MMLPQKIRDEFPQNTVDIIALNHQLNKDFRLVGLNYEFDSDTINHLYDSLINTLQLILKTHPASYQSLLYRIDLPEKVISYSDKIEEIAYYILKREYQKIVLRKKYS